MDGYFTHADTGGTFYFDQADEAVLAPPPHGGRNMVYNHRVWLENDIGGQGWRHAVVMGTRAYVITDEMECDGRTWWVTEKWNIKKLRRLSK